MQPRTDAPRISSDHITTQAGSFRAHLGRAIESASAHEKDAALASIEKGASAFDQLVGYMVKRTDQDRSDLNMGPITRSLTAARELLGTRSWADAIGQLRQLESAGLSLIGQLSGQMGTSGQGNGATIVRNGRGGSNGSGGLKHKSRGRHPRHRR